MSSAITADASLDLHTATNAVPIASVVEDDDDKHLAKLGYEKVLYKGLASFTNFAFGFTEVAILPSVISTWNYGLTYGGPQEIFFGFLVTFIMTMCVSLSMAEISSAYPSAGCVYHWTAQIVPEKQAPLASYVCGWFNFLGNAAGDAGFAYSFAGLLNAAITISQPLSSRPDSARRLLSDPTGLPSISPTGVPTIAPTYAAGYSSRGAVGVSIATLIVWSLLNVFRVDKVGFINGIAAVVHMSSIIIIVVAVLVLPTTLSDNAFVFENFHTDDYSNTDINNRSYVGAIGLLFAVYCFAGYEACGHMAEETTNAKVNAPRGIILTNIGTGLGGLALIVSMLYATTDISQSLSGDPLNYGDTGYAAVNLFVSRLPIQWGRALTWLVVVNLFFAGVSSCAVTGRMVFALMRDNALPYGHIFSRVHPTFKSPIWAIAFVGAVDIVILLIPLNDNGVTAFYAIIGLTVVGFQTSYAIPVFLKFIYRPADFPKSPYDLGIFSIPLGIASSSWLLGTCALFFLPIAYPATVENTNWLILVVGTAFILCGLNWIFNARFTFKGPKRFHAEISSEEKGVVAKI